MYDKKLLTDLFAKYCETGAESDLVAVVQSCEGMIAMIISKYPAFSPHHDDVIQDVKISLWMGMKNIERMRKELISPVTFLYFRVWAYIYRSLRKYSKQFGLPFSITLEEEEVMRMKEDGLDFADIAKEMGSDEETVVASYKIGKVKKAGAVTVGIDEVGFLAEKGYSTTLDPAKAYEVRETLEIFEKELKRLAHTRYKGLRWAAKIFEKDVVGRAREEIEDE